MDLSGIPPVSSQSAAAFRSDWSPRKTDVQALATALQSGDLAGAQKEFSDFQQLLTGGPAGPQGSSGGTTPTGASSLSVDLQAVGSALQSGDLTGAQKAFASLQQAIGKMRSRHHHHHHHSDSSLAAGSVAASSGASAPDGSSKPSAVLDVRA